MNNEFSIMAQFVADTTNTEFKKSLISAPKSFLQGLGFNLPETVEVEVFQNDNDNFYFVIPLQSTEGNLSDEELDGLNAAKGNNNGSASTVLSAGTASSFPTCLGSASSIGTAGSKGSGS